MVAACYLLGVSTRWMDKLVASLGITSLPKSQVSEMAKDLDAHVEQFRPRSLAKSGPFTFVAADALILKVREGGRVVPVHALVATGVNTDGHRGLVNATSATLPGASWRRCRSHYAANLMRCTPNRSAAVERAIAAHVID